MIAYHVERTEKYHPDQIVSLSDISIFDGQNSEFMAHILFPEGVSTNGKRFLSDTAYFVNPPYQLSEIINGSALSASFFMEYSLEFVRRSYFPQLPSRYQSFFSFKSIDDILNWTELTKTSYEFWEVDIGNDYYVFDSNLLKGGIALFLNQDNQLIQQFSAGFNFKFAYDYWNKVESDNPRFEILARFPISIIKKVESIPR